MSEKRLYFDLETYSECPITKGTYVYAADISTEILMTAFAFGDDDVRVETGLPEVVRQALLDPGVTKVAWNSSFERVVCSAQTGLPVGEYLPVTEWDDPMARARLFGYPASLAGAGAALLAQEDQKDAEGKRLIKLFSQPDRKGRRADPAEHRVDWEMFLEYCRQDVHTLRELDRVIPPWPQDGVERRVWQITERINDRGVGVDIETCSLADRASKRNKDELVERLKLLTGCENPNSPAQLCAWLSTRLGEEVKSVAKGEVSLMLSRTDIPDDVRTVLNIRQALGLTAAKKFATFQELSNSDSRLRGALRYCGAHSGRWTAKGLNLQNLPHDKILEPQVEALKLDLQLGRRPGEHELRGLVRPMIEGDLCVVDFSQIEARVLPWIAGDEDTLKAFRDGRDLYTEAAKAMGEGFTRQDGKIATLACLADDTPVLTKKGWVPIALVTPGDEVWDGETWVPTDGAIYKGEKEVITYGSLTATPDHRVWTTLLEQPVRLDAAARLRAPLAEPRPGGPALRTVGDHRTRPALQRALGPRPRTSAVSRVRLLRMGASGQLDAREEHAVQLVLRRERRSTVATEAVPGSGTTVHEPQRSRVRQLRRARYHVRVRLGARSGRVGHVGAGTRSGQGNRSSGQRTWLRTRKPALGYKTPKQPQQEMLRSASRLGVSRGRVAVHAQYRGADATRRTIAGGYSSPSAASRSRQAQGLEAYLSKTRVYDLLNCGPNNRFLTAGGLVHNCGYGGGWRALLAFGGENMLPGYTERRLKLVMDHAPDKEFVRLDKELEAHLQKVVTAWRQARPEIVSLWRDLEDDLVPASRFFVNPGGGTRGLKLPSGRVIWYRDVRRKGEVTPWGETRATYSCKDERGGRLQLNRMTLSNNLVQGTARDILAAALIRLGDAGYRVVNMVHDEVIVEAPESELDTIQQIMTETPSWAKGLPIGADGYFCNHYVKK